MLTSKYPNRDKYLCLVSSSSQHPDDLNSHWREYILHLYTETRYKIWHRHRSLGTNIGITSSIWLQFLTPGTRSLYRGAKYTDTLALSSLTRFFFLLLLLLTSLPPRPRPRPLPASLLSTLSTIELGEGATLILRSSTDVGSESSTSVFVTSETWSKAFRYQSSTLNRVLEFLNFDINTTCSGQCRYLRWSQVG